MERSEGLKRFGQFIRGARKGAGLTQLALGAELGFSGGQFVSDLERGVRALPPEHIPRLSRAISVDQNDILNRLVEVQSERIRERSKGA